MTHCALGIDVFNNDIVHWQYFVDGALALVAGWQKLCEGKKGLRWKSWIRTKILGPSIRYFVALLIFVAIYALFGRLWAKTTHLSRKEQIRAGQKFLRPFCPRREAACVLCIDGTISIGECALCTMNCKIIVFCIDDTIGIGQNPFGRHLVPTETR